MIIRRVKLANILSHENTEIDFPDGVVSIVGSNGAGKSSIIDSMYIALFSDAKPDIRGGKKEFIVMRGRKNGEISVLFEVGGSRYLVTRELSVEGSSQAYLYVLEGDRKRLRATGITEVVNELSRILGLSTISGSDLKKLIRGTIIALQDELTEIINISDSKRREWILSLLGLSYLEKALESVKKAISEKDKLEGELRGELRMLEKEKQELQDVRRKVSEKVAKVKEVEARIKELESKREARSHELSIIDEAIELSSKLKVALISSKVKELEAVINRLKLIDSWDSNEYVRLANELGRRRKEREAIRTQYISVLNELSSKIGVSVSSLDELNELDAELRVRRDELSDSVGGKKALKELYLLYVEKFESSKECPICGSTINEPNLIKEKLIKELNNLSKAIKELSAEYTSVDAKLRIIEKYLDKLKELRSREEYLNNELRDLEIRLGRLSSLAISLCSTVAEVGTSSLDECVEELNKRKEELQRARSELDIIMRNYGGLVSGLGVSLEELLNKLTRCLDFLGIRLAGELTPQSIDELIRDLLNRKKAVDADLNRLVNDLSNLKAERKSLNDLISEYNEAIKKLEADIKEREGRVKELERKIKAYEVIEDFSIKFLGKNGIIARELTKVVRSELERRANVLLSKLNLRPIAINDDFQISIKVLGGELPVSNASGGEKVGISIALRLALAELIMGRFPTTLVLDEPTIYLDEERKTQIFKIISELGRTLRQVIVVTHDEDVVEISNKVIRVENVGEVSRIQVFS